MGAGTFAFWLALYLYVPVLPLHAEELGASLSMVGLVVASYAIAQLLLRIPIGVAADLLGRRKPFAAGALACSAAGAVGLALSPDPWSLFAARTVVGVGAAGWVAISVLYSSYYPPNRTLYALSRLMTINTTGLLAATFAGGLISEHLGTGTAFYAAAATGAAGAVLMLAAREPESRRTGSYSAATFVRVARTPLLLLAGGIGILAQFVTFGGSYGFVPLHAERIGASDAEVGFVTTAMLFTQVLGTMATTRHRQPLGQPRRPLPGVGARGSEHGPGPLHHGRVDPHGAAGAGRRRPRGGQHRAHRPQPAGHRPRGPGHRGWASTRRSTPSACSRDPRRRGTWRRRPAWTPCSTWRRRSRWREGCWRWCA